MFKLRHYRGGCRLMSKKSTTVSDVKHQLSLLKHKKKTLEEMITDVDSCFSKLHEPAVREMLNHNKQSYLDQIYSINKDIKEYEHLLKDGKLTL